jgi:riboflavin kinase
LFAEGNIKQGYGRGSKKLGFPTANLPQFHHQIEHDKLKLGVYFGWSKIRNDENIYGFVANIGKSPTFVGQVCYMLLFFLRNL